MDTYEKEQHDNAQSLSDTLNALGFTTKVIKGDDGRADYKTILTYSDIDHIVRKDYKGFISIYRTPYAYYPNVSSYRQSEIRKEVYTSQNMKVLTAKKVLEKITEEVTCHNKLRELELENIRKVSCFVDTLQASKLDVVYGKDQQSGYVVKNGLEYSFEIQQDGYIKQDIRVHYTADNNLENFLKLSDNKFTK